MEHDKSSCSESARASDGDTVLPVAAERTMTGNALSFTRRQGIRTAASSYYWLLRQTKDDGGSISLGI